MSCFRRGEASAVLFSLTVLSGCAAEITDSEVADIGLVQQAFKENNPDSFSPSALMGNLITMTVCVQVLDGEPVSLATRQAEVRVAIGQWLDAMRPISGFRLPSASQITLACSGHSATIRFHGPGAIRPDGKYPVSGTQKGVTDMYPDPLHPPKTVLLHELGHQFGLDHTYLGNGCIGGQPDSVMCERGSPTVLSQDDIRGIQEAYCTRYWSNCVRAWEADLRWCYGNQQLLIGDFNGDGRDDMLCHDKGNGTKWITFASSRGTFDGLGWSKDMLGWCADPEQLYIGDFNGDGFDDMLCHSPMFGKKWVALNSKNSTNVFPGTSSEWNEFWCGGGDQLLIGDFNRDNRDDLLCHGVSGGQKWIAFAEPNGSFTRTSWGAELHWCPYVSNLKRQIKIGDFNGDGRDDMLCHDRGIAGDLLIALAKPDGTFSGTNFFPNFSYCGTGGLDLAAQLEVGDFNADGRADLLCHNPQTGKKQIAMALSDGSFLGGPERLYFPKWCTHANGQLLVGNFDGLPADMLCHDRATGRKWIRQTPP